MTKEIAAELVSLGPLQSEEQQNVVSYLSGVSREV